MKNSIRDQYWSDEGKNLDLNIGENVAMLSDRNKYRTDEIKQGEINDVNSQC